MIRYILCLVASFDVCWRATLRRCHDSTGGNDGALPSKVSLFFSEPWAPRLLNQYSGMVALLIALICLPVALQAQQAQTSAYLGYAFPSGGQTGETFRVLLGGRYLSGAQSIIVSGEGVEVEIVKHYAPLRNLNGPRKTILKMKMAQREFELSGKEIPKKLTQTYEKLTEAELKKDAMPPSAMFDGIEMMDTDQLKALKVYLDGFNLRQYNAQIAEQVALDVTITKDAALGVREMRIVSKMGLSNPIRFQVSSVAEVSEREPNDDASSYSSTPIVKQLPAVINGQVMPGDVDRFMFHFEPGQRVCFDLMARRLIPYVADAVPGWFQATLAIYDHNGTRLAYVDDTYGDPDPRLDYTFLHGGTYLVEVRDAIYRGRENFVYRLFVSSDPLQENALRHEDVDYTAKSMPLLREDEPNQSSLTADTVSLPQVVVGRIDEPSDVDLYAFNGRAGDTLIAKVEARYFDSPMDSLLRLIGPRGEMLALNDDHMDKRNHLHMGPGLMTHYADSYLSYQLRENGRYLISIEDVQRSGGADYKYRLRLSNPIPDFEVRVSPSSLNVKATSYTALRFYVNRLDGFNGPLEFQLIDPPKGVRLNHARVAAGQNEVWATLEWAGAKRFNLSTLQIEAVAKAGDRETRRPVVPADNSMQAFLWRHLLPAQELHALSLGSYNRLAVVPSKRADVLNISEGKVVDLVLPVTRAVKNPERVVFRLSEAPEGISLLSSKLDETGIHLQFECADPLVIEQTKGNLIVEAFDSRENTKSKKVTEYSVGMLPAIPYQISISKKRSSEKVVKL